DGLVGSCFTGGLTTGGGVTPGLATVTFAVPRTPPAVAVTRKPPSSGPAWNTPSASNAPPATVHQGRQARRLPVRFRLRAGENEHLIGDLHLVGRQTGAKEERLVPARPSLADVGQHSILHAPRDRLLYTVAVEQARKQRRGEEGVAYRLGAPLLHRR